MICTEKFKVKIVQTLRERKLRQIVVNNCEFTNRNISARIIYFLTERVYCIVVSFLSRFVLDYKG